MTAEADGTASAVRAILGALYRGCLALRAWAPPATAIRPLRGRREPVGASPALWKIVRRDGL